MSDDTNTSTSLQSKSDNAENMEQYLLQGRGSIIQKLRQLGKGKNLITAHFGGGKYSLLTAVVDVLPDKDLLVLDYGANETMNQKILTAERIVCKTQHQGITAQFTLHGMQRAKLGGKTAFACPLPDSLLWVQRREYYRVTIPRSDQAVCGLPDADEILHSYPLLDISIAGLALHVTDSAACFEPGQVFQGCRLELSDTASGQVTLEVQNVRAVREDEPAAGTRIGCRFVELHPDLGASIQRYIHAVEAMRRRTED